MDIGEHPAAVAFLFLVVPRTVKQCIPSASKGSIRSFVHGDIRYHIVQLLSTLILQNNDKIARRVIFRDRERLHPFTRSRRVSPRTVIVGVQPCFLPATALSTPALLCS